MDKKTNETSKSDTIYSEATVDTTTSGTKETLLQKVDYAIWSMGNLEEYFLNKLSKATSKTQGNEIYEEYLENMGNRIENFNELEADFLAIYTNYYEHEKDQYIFPDSLQQNVDLFKNTELEFWEIGEGFVEIRYKPYHYYNIFKGKVTDDYEYFLKNEAKENTVLYSADAGILISPKDIGERVLTWEKFIIQYPKSPLLDQATKLYQEYCYDYLMGMENTRTVDYSEGSLESENKKEYKRFISKNPNSRTTKIIKAFLTQVEANPDYEELDKWVKKELNIKPVIIPNEP
ncbi:hypothetical protein WMW71_04040 [Flavobacterium buctense]|uniref:Uncharacterized protein n=1 Tax=Flavobacterium buctense TaxID=1648146 RepID=A0ABU9DYN9_9FLAO|nr:hypothetical protein [Flavobacterium buctense]